VGISRELRLIVCLKEQAHHFADQFIDPCRQAQGAQLPVFLRYVNPAGRMKPVPLGSQFTDDPVNHCHGHAVSGPAVDSGRHRPLIGVDVPVCHQEQVPVEQLPVNLIARQPFPAALAEDFKYHFGSLHYAYHMVL
jgi:hypothetical protein